MLFDPKICISGAAGGAAAVQGEPLGFRVGQEIAKRGGIVVTGATSGVPFAGVRGAKALHGQTIGFSPAHSAREHLKKYRLPLQYHDIVFFTGLDYAGRDTLLIDLSDAVIQVSGRIGSLHEFTHSFERHKIIGILLHSGGLSDDMKSLLEKGQRGMGRTVMHEDPAELVRMVFASLEAEHAVD